MVRAHPLPPPGPPWFTSIMGTALLALVLQLYSAGIAAISWLAITIFCAVWVWFSYVLLRWAVDAIRQPHTSWFPFFTAELAPLWGTVAMGFLSMAAATNVVGAQFFIRIGVDNHEDLFTPLAVATFLWCTGTLIGLCSLIGFLTLLIRTQAHEKPAPLWGLPLVPPMVSSTVGSGMIPRFDTDVFRQLIMFICGVEFVMSFTVAGVVFLIAYLHIMNEDALPIAVKPTAWIPLGIVGQSAAAAIEIATGLEEFLTQSAHRFSLTISLWYNIAMGIAAVFVISYAAKETLAGFHNKLPFSPAWWAMPFPIGTVPLALYWFTSLTDMWETRIAGIIGVVILCGVWSLVFGRNMVAVWQLHRSRVSSAS